MTQRIQRFSSRQGIVLDKLRELIPNLPIVFFSEENRGGKDYIVLRLSLDSQADCLSEAIKENLAVKADRFVPSDALHPSLYYPVREFTKALGVFNEYLLCPTTEEQAAARWN